VTTEIPGKGWLLKIFTNKKRFSHLIMSEKDGPKPSFSVREKDDDDEFSMSRYLEKVLLFLVEPNSSRYAFYWSLFQCYLVVLDVIFLVLESMDGPNNYTGMPDKSQYSSLLTEQVFFFHFQNFLIPCSNID
jgi:hypothetical protein